MLRPFEQRKFLFNLNLHEEEQHFPSVVGLAFTVFVETFSQTSLCNHHLSGNIYGEGIRQLLVGRTLVPTVVIFFAFHANLCSHLASDF